ncbi:type IV toxin-antitoxin system AbiEi family antitoxin domain-containing protein [Agromyces sp. H3Y2-19a]|uniref:type IV toxin-antitoxin system AbiEi family antitoxin domain-containing protein n=1 Tax=Agromyces chromiiresistens TaxID=3030835 RepID=UPI0023B98B1E|nr:type IV toxin-antitoxin system AbiEi family antitoxin domain-containing protein [Agromyces chromiiresistens]MDF0512492.1 type IV toxin-antitoxin system AbiEi family antitoxin domain-containing protein [Agromyces chromiiresistens]
MKGRDALRVLANVSESQWGMVTSAQAGARGVSHMNLTRLTESGDLIRLSHGVYRDAGAPADRHEDLRAAWLATDPTRLAYERLREIPKGAVVSGESAAKLHGIGDLRAMKSEFTSPTRRQTQRADIRYRTRGLPEEDVTVREGLPTTTRERTIADLVEDRNDFSIVGNALRDAARQSSLNIDRLTELLSPLAERNGYRKGDGNALLDELMHVAGIDQESLAKQIASISSLGSLVTTQYLGSLPKIDVTPILEPLVQQLADLYPREEYSKLIAPISEALSKAALSALPDMSKIAGEIASSAMEPVHAQLAEQLRAADWASLARTTQPKGEATS